MNQLLYESTKTLADFLQAKLPLLSDSENWWKKKVVGVLSFQQQRMVEERRLFDLKQLDFAALLRVLDQNWYELSNKESLPREGRNRIKELQTVRNKWAHLSPQSVPPSDLYRDADTLGRLLDMLGADAKLIESVDAFKAAAVAEMSDAQSQSAQNSSATTSRHVPEITRAPQPTVKIPQPVSATSRFKIGELVSLRSARETIFPILEVVKCDIEYRYTVFQGNRKALYFESQLQRPVAKADEPVALSVDRFHAFLTSVMLLSPSSANLFSLRSGRVHFVPYQYRPVLKLIRADRPRLLIADEVGVGKTIEAGLIIKELRARMDISSVLILCPKALVAERKWYLEMKRFDEQFTAIDGPTLRHCLRETNLDGEWPEQYAKAIVPFSLFDSDLLFGKVGKGRKAKEGLLDLDPPPKFDLVIVDEAHHIRNSETYLHQAVRYFCDNAQSVIFLTATPVQLGSEDLFTLLNVLRPDLVIDPASFQIMAAPNRPINLAVRYCRAAKEGWRAEAWACLEEAAQTEWGRLFLRESPAFQTVYDRLDNDPIDDAGRIGVTRALEELYTFSPLINRTRRRDIGEFTTRNPETLPVPFTDEQQQLHDNLLSLVGRIVGFSHGQQNVKFMMTTIRRQSASCLYGLAPLLRDILNRKLNRLEAMEAGDSDAEPDYRFLTEVQLDIESLLQEADNLDPHDANRATDWPY